MADDTVYTLKLEFPGGLNKRDAVPKPEFLTEAYNVMVGKQGELSKRPGLKYNFKVDNDTGFVKNWSQIMSVRGDFHRMLIVGHPRSSSTSWGGSKLWIADSHGRAELTDHFYEGDSSNITTFNPQTVSDFTPGHPPSPPYTLTAAEYDALELFFRMRLSAVEADNWTDFYVSGDPLGTDTYSPVVHSGYLDPCWNEVGNPDFSRKTISDFDGTANTFPVARFFVQWNDALLAGNVWRGGRQTGGTLFQSRVYQSSVGDFDQWGANDYWDFSPEDGYNITGLELFGEALVVFKEHSVQMLTGSSAETYTRYVLDTRLGTRAPNSVVNTGRGIVFWSGREGVFHFDGSEFTRLDEHLGTAITDHAIDHRGNWCFASAFFWDNKYWLSIPKSERVNGWDVEAEESYVYDFTTGAWSRLGVGWLGSVVQDGTPYLVGVQTPDHAEGNGVATFGLADQEDDEWLDGSTTSVRAHFTTADIPSGDPGTINKVLRSDSVWDAATAGTGGYGYMALEPNFFDPADRVYGATPVASGDGLVHKYDFTVEENSWGTSGTNLRHLRDTGWSGVAARWLRFHFNEGDPDDDTYHWSTPQGWALHDWTLTMASGLDTRGGNV